MFTRILKNKIFRVSALLLLITFPFSSKYRFVKTVGPSMHPTFVDGEWFIIERASSLGWEWSPRRFDKVVIKDSGENLCKRIIGLRGDTVEIKEGRIHLNGEELKDPFGDGEISYYLVDENDNDLVYWSGPKAGQSIIRLVNQGAEKIPAGFVWVIGDNRRDSWFGLLPAKDIVGKILY